MTHNEIISKGYSIYRKDRSTRGGGVLITVRDCISSIIKYSPEELEVVTVSLGLKQEFTLCSVYVPPIASLQYIHSLCT